MSILLICLECKENRLFRLWFKRNILVAVLFTILAAVDIEILSILSSQVAGLMTFNAPMSHKTKMSIYWGTIISLVFEDMPQFYIQVCKFFFKKIKFTKIIIN
jgi:hypothetical protein